MERVVCPHCGNDEYFYVYRLRDEGARDYFWDQEMGGYEEVECGGISGERLIWAVCSECNTILDDKLLRRLLESSFPERGRAKGLVEMEQGWG